MRLFAAKGHFELLDGQTHRFEPLVGPGMHHHGRVHVVEVAGVDEIDLSATALFGGRAEQGDREVEFIAYCGQSNGGTERRGGDDVMTAGVTDVGQSVILGAKGNVQVAASLGGPESGRP